MSGDKRKKRTEIRRPITADQKKKIEAIVAEAEATGAVDHPNSEKGPSGLNPASDALLRRHLDESERKRLMLTEALHASRDQLRKIRGLPDETDERALPFGFFVDNGRETPEGRTAIIRHHGRLYEARVETPESFETPGPKGATFHALRQHRQDRDRTPGNFQPGELLLLNNDLRVIEARGFDLICGNLATVDLVLNDEKLLIRTVGDETILVKRAQPMMKVNLVVGDNVEYDPDSLFVYSLLPKGQVDRLALEKVPDISFAEIGGLSGEVQQIRDAIELPHLFPEYFREHQLVPPKGILLFGPPGCGKTLIAKAVANSLARSICERTGEKGESYFLNIKGPELLNKYVGATEQAIRDLFARARHQATYRTPVVIFFDEMDAMFRVRGSGISSDMEATIVPQLLAELDGLQTLEHVVVIGATNREDLIDPALLRPGRLDRKIRIPRPDRQAAVDIFTKYLTPDLPIDSGLLESCGGPEEAVQGMIARAVEEMYSLKPENELLEISFADGSRKILYSQDLCSGAIIANITRRAKFMAVKDLVQCGHKGLRIEHILQAIRSEFDENEDLPSSSNAAEWHRIIGRGGERVIRVRSLQGPRAAQDGSRPGASPVNVPDQLK